MKKIKKIIPYFLILIILVGLFSPMLRVNAQIGYGVDTRTTEQKAADKVADKAAAEKEAASAAATLGNDPFKKEIIDGCGVSPWTWFNGCLLLVFYYTTFQLPSWVLWLSAQFFDVMIDLGIDSSVTSASDFIPAAWGVVRDFSNIFFILILLYVAIQTILGLGHETKKIIVRVVIIALLINFSMFFTKVVIDSSNILALIFYNNLDVNTKNADGTSRPKDPALKDGKDIAGAMWKNFDATKLMTLETIKLLKTTTIEGKTVKEDRLPFSLTLGIMIIAGAIMLWAAYAFFIAGLMFIGRLIELWVLIIFSPFAFMSWTVPKLAGVEYLGWDAWFKRLISTSFMASIFMFFIFLIFKILPHISSFSRGNTETILGTILGILIPAIVIMALLLKATEFAKKGGGQFGEMIMKGAKMAGGLALGAATGGTALALTSGIGGLASKAASSKGLQDAAKETGLKGIAGRMALRTADYGSKASFDMRNIKGVGALAKAGGLNLESSKAIGLGVKEGGYEKARADKVKKRQARAKELEVREDEPLKQAVNTAEQDLQGLLNKVAKDFERIDKDLIGARQEKLDTKSGSPEEATAIAKIKALNDEKNKIKTGVTGITVVGGVNNGKTIKEMQNEVIPYTKNEVVKENRERKWAYAERIEKWGKIGFKFKGKSYNYSFGARERREASQKIRMEAKLDSGTKEERH